MGDDGDTSSGTDPGEDALARAAALGPLPGIHDEDDEVTPGGHADRSVGQGRGRRPDHLQPPRLTGTACCTRLAGSAR